MMAMNVSVKISASSLAGPGGSLANIFAVDIRRPSAGALARIVRLEPGPNTRCGFGFYQLAQRLGSGAWAGPVRRPGARAWGAKRRAAGRSSIEVYGLQPVIR